MKQLYPISLLFAIFCTAIGTEQAAPVISPDPAIQSLFVKRTSTEALFDVGTRFGSETLARPALMNECQPAVDYASRAMKKKAWTIVLFMAADNDLYPFAKQNIAQLEEVGSNENCNILVYLNTKLPGKQKVTKRLYIEKNRIYQVGPDFQSDSGSAEALGDTMLWAIHDFPSDHIAIVLWNHGVGALNPVMRHTINPAYLFRYNAEKNLIELDRRIQFMEFIDMMSQSNATAIPARPQNRGICFDDTYQSYLDDQKLTKAFAQAVAERNGAKIDIVLFDACLMQMVEIHKLLAPYANYAVGSQEVVLGPGYNYREVFIPFTQGVGNSKALAQYVVGAYENFYAPITHDYTQSACDLALYDNVHDTIDNLAALLVEALLNQRAGSVRAAIRAARNPQICTHFDEPSYIDLKTFYENLNRQVGSMDLGNKALTQEMRLKIGTAIRDGLKALDAFVIANASGQNLQSTGGVSIYFPERKINNPHHNSYPQTEFAKNNSWLKFLQTYL